MRRLLILALIGGMASCAASVPALADPPGLSFDEATPLPGLNALFERTEGWIGADGAHTVDLGPKRRLWLFSDTWVGRVRDGKRVDPTMVNNSLGLQDGGGATGKVRFVVRKNAGNKSVAVFTPADGRGWFWLQAGAYANNKLFLLLSQIEKTRDPGVFGFRQFGQTLGIVDNPDDDPNSWRLEQRKLPCTIFSPERILTFGAAVVRDDDYLYLYGTDEDIKPTGPERYLIVARVPVSTIADFATWRFHDGAGWSDDFRASKRLVSGMASEGSVSYFPNFKQYVLVYTDGGLSPRILARTAAAPAGPWSDAAVLYRCPESDRDKKLFCYAAKAHRSLGAEDELVVSYVANSFDFWQVLRDATIYLPRFIRVKARMKE